MLYIGPIYQIVMNDLTNDQIDDFENEQRVISRALSMLDVGTVSQTVRSGTDPSLGVILYLLIFQEAQTRNQ